MKFDESKNMRDFTPEFLLNVRASISELEQNLSELRALERNILTVQGVEANDLMGVLKANQGIDQSYEKAIE